MEGVLDWYALGVLLGLAVAQALAAIRAMRGDPAFVVVSVLLVAAAVALVVVLLPWWALAAWALADAVAMLSLRLLSAEAVPAALVAAVALAAVPFAGYLEVLAAPVVGQRLSRRAASRYAGLRVLARD